MATKKHTTKKKVKARPRRRKSSSASSIPPGPAGPADIPGQKIGNFRCDVCDTPFPSQDELNTHREQAHKT
jgi:hypothetical protein